MNPDPTTRPVSDKRIVFDAGGVLFADGSKDLMEMIAGYGDKDADTIEQHYREVFHKPLMRGELTEADFWPEMLSFAGAKTDDQAQIRQRLLDEILTDLPAVSRLEGWSRRAELWILSNHRHEWLLERLDAAGATELFDTILISSQIGSRKPEPAAFAHLARSDKHTVYVDDKQTNLDMAAGMGYDTLLADADGAWHAKLDVWLES